MIDLEFLQALIRSIDESSIDSVEIERGGTRVRVSKTPDVTAAPVSMASMPAVPQAPAPPAPAAPPPQADAMPDGARAGGVSEAPAQAPADNLVEIKSPMVGTFYRAASPDSDPYVSEGKSISSGDTLCIIEAMKLMNELEAEVGGVIREICVENAEPVEYGQVLFRIEPS
jgi:acetyl-CoA carboxylase biotin carboxyl carrier protein